MLNVLKKTLLAAGVALGCAGMAHAAPDSLSAFDATTAGSWAEKLVICDVTAFLAGKPDLNANVIYVRRDDGRADMMLPPDFVGAGQWYKEDYQRLYWRLKRQDKVDHDQLQAAQNTLGRDFVDAYRRNGWTLADANFLRRQDSYCRKAARAEGVIVS